MRPGGKCAPAEDLDGKCLLFCALTLWMSASYVPPSRAREPFLSRDIQLVTNFVLSEKRFSVFPCFASVCFGRGSLGFSTGSRAAGERKGGRGVAGGGGVVVFSAKRFAQISGNCGWVAGEEGRGFGEFPEIKK